MERRAFITLSSAVFGAVAVSDSASALSLYPKAFGKEILSRA